MIAWALSLGALAAEGPVEVRAWLEDAAGGGGVWVVQTAAPAELTLDWRVPAVPRVELSRKDDARVERVGDLVVTTTRVVYSAPPGRYELPAVDVGWSDPEGHHGTATGPALFVDVGVPPPRDGELVDIVEPPPIGVIPWVAIGVGASVTALFAAGIAYAFRRPREEEVAPAPPDPPDVRALRAWDEARRDPALDPHARAVALSRIFREYLDAALNFPASARTTRETLTHLQALPHLGERDVACSDRLLRATDLVKYADVDADDALFTRLDADLRAVIANTRPHRWDEGS